MDFRKENIHLIPNWFRSNPGVSLGWCEPPDGVQKWNPESSSYLKVVNSTWKSPKISELYFQKKPWKITDLKRNFVILEIINSISSSKNDGISFILLIKSWMVYAVSMKSMRSHITGNEAEFLQNPYEIVSSYDGLKDGF